MNKRTLFQLIRDDNKTIIELRVAASQKKVYLSYACNLISLNLCSIGIDVSSYGIKSSPYEFNFFAMRVEF